MVASDPCLNDLLSQLRPDTRKVVLGTSLAGDVERLRQLLTLSPVDQGHLARRVHLGMEWVDEFESLRSAGEAKGMILTDVGNTVEADSTQATTDVSPGTESQRMSATLEKGPSSSTERRSVDALKANPHNASLFPDSLADPAIALIAEDLKAHGQDVPIRITPSGIIVDGERRWRAAKKLCWPEVDVVVGLEMTEQEILDRVIGSCTSSRQMTLREQVNIYMAVAKQLKRTGGRTQGRPKSKTKPNGDLFLSPTEISEIAAAKARFDSVKSAERAKAIFSRGSAELQYQVCGGELSLSAGYQLVPKRPRASSKPAEHANARGVTEEEEEGPGKVSSDEVAPKSAREAHLRRSPIAAQPEGAQDSTASEDVALEAERAAENVDQSSSGQSFEKERHPDEREHEEGKGDFAASGRAHPSLDRASKNQQPVRSEKSGVSQRRDEVADDSSRNLDSDHAARVELTIDDALDRLYEHLNNLICEEDILSAKRFAARVIVKMKELLGLSV